MIGIVIVSHSLRLAEGVKELAVQMTHGFVPIEVAAGIDDPDNPIGTDPMKVAAAITAVHAAAPDGVLVLMDLGSAILSAETALDFLPEAVKATVRLCAAPLAEGAVCAAVHAAAGGSLDAAVAEAHSALAAKQQHVTPPTGYGPVAAVASAAKQTDSDTFETRLVIRNRLGLHARPIATLVDAAAKFQSVITVVKGATSASVKSVNQLAMLSVGRDDEIWVRAVGADAKAAIAAIEALNSVHFGEKDTEISQFTTPADVAGAVEKDGFVLGVPASAGVAVGPAHLYRPALSTVATRSVNDPQVEIARLTEALNTARKEIGALAAGAQKTAEPEAATIFDFHRLLLHDVDLVRTAKKTIRKRKIAAEAAWQRVMEATADAYRSLDNAYMQARAADVVDAGNRVLGKLIAKGLPALFLEAPALVVAPDLLPSEVARFDPEKVLGIVTAVGGSTSHAAILARSLGIPAVVGGGPAVFSIAQGAMIAIDGDSGRIWLCPNEEIQRELQGRRTQWLRKRRRYRAERHTPAVTTDGVVIHVTANIGGPHDAHHAFDYGANGVGLFRTEFLFQKRATAPTEDEQYAAYVDAATAMQGQPVIIRTLDVGGDKPPFYATVTGAVNPFLGQRGIRFCLAQPDVFKSQLRALLRAAREANIRIMLPMVAQLAELRAARALLEEARKELTEEGIVCERHMATGIMIEVPAAVAIADQLAKEADFFSIGTNDLTQYVMAADRGNAAVAHLCNSLHPAVLRMVRTAVEAGHRAGIPVGMCGELAGNPSAAPILIGLGLDELSVNAPGVPEVKAAIRKLSAAECRDLTAKALDQYDGDAVRKLLTNAG